MSGDWLECRMAKRSGSEYFTARGCPRPWCGCGRFAAQPDSAHRLSRASTPTAQKSAVQSPVSDDAAEAGTPGTSESPPSGAGAGPEPRPRSPTPIAAATASGPTRDAATAAVTGSPGQTTATV